ncbi:MAG TPA: 4Fe-4S binding protein [Candidatus Mediterraneibacter merdipullorum]|nr:4Fe-4S binding protein [Candidatus Mediterraneibacter merdipullorum]
MIRKIIQIDEEKCNGCGACAQACHEGAIGMVNGRAKLLRDDYCDGLGDCLPACPTGAITFVEREAAAYDEKAVQENMKKKKGAKAGGSQLGQWPCQLKLVPTRAPYYDGADLLIAADCSAYAYAGMHDGFMRGKVTLIGCPKLDAVDYSEKLTHIFRDNDIRSVTVVRMEVPCCGGLEMAVRRALEACGKSIPWEVATISISGELLAR